jgi:hypothetical protein
MLYRFQKLSSVVWGKTLQAPARSQRRHVAGCIPAIHIDEPISNMINGATGGIRTEEFLAPYNSIRLLPPLIFPSKPDGRDF